ncbi:hypothetical protein PR002_g13733 [Phytophthora rubi]|nr:hypothetical protein PR002_g13733 [Phytophthora rubi]
MATELLGVRELLGELGITHDIPMSLCVDNQAALNQLDGEDSSSKAKHIDVRVKFVGALVKRAQGRVPREREDASRRTHQGLGGAKTG